MMVSFVACGCLALEFTFRAPDDSLHPPQQFGVGFQCLVQTTQACRNGVLGTVVAKWHDCPLTDSLVTKEQERAALGRFLVLPHRYRGSEAVGEFLEGFGFNILIHND